MQTQRSKKLQDNKCEHSIVSVHRRGWLISPGTEENIKVRKGCTEGRNSIWPRVENESFTAKTLAQSPPVSSSIGKESGCHQSIFTTNKKVNRLKSSQLCLKPVRHGRTQNKPELPRLERQVNTRSYGFPEQKSPGGKNHRGNRGQGRETELQLTNCWRLPVTSLTVKTPEGLQKEPFWKMSSWEGLLQGHQLTRPWPAGYYYQSLTDLGTGNVQRQLASAILSHLREEKKLQKHLIRS